jgi:hypothetical protein
LPKPPPDASLDERALAFMRAGAEQGGNGVVFAFDPQAGTVERHDLRKSRTGTTATWVSRPVVLRQFLRGTRTPAPVPHPSSGRAPRSRRSVTRARARAPDDDHLPQHSCAVCGSSLAGRRKHALTCGGRCRTELHRRREREALQRRHEAALKLAKRLHPDDRIDLLAAVVWPLDERLGPAVLGATA